MNISNVLTKDFLIKVANFEGYRSKPYKCAAGYWTIGFGTRMYDYDGKTKVSVSIDESYLLLKNHLRKIYFELDKLLKLDHFSVSQVQALLDFCYNCGVSRLKNSSMWFYLLRYNRKSPHTKKVFDTIICNVLKKYCHAGNKVLLGLQIRRNFETRLWLY